MFLNEENNRYVMFPIKDSEIWSMYKAQVECFWRPEEIDLSKDLVHWETRLTGDEKRYISMILAFFCGERWPCLRKFGFAFYGRR